MTPDLHPSERPPMPVKVRIPSPLRSYTNGVDVVEANGETVAAVLAGVVATA